MSFEAQREIILVDSHDNPVGSGEKLAVHREGTLHRAFSVFVFNRHDQLLLQKRAATKYHSAGLWANTCCSHPAPGSDLVSSARKRLREEMGFSCELQKTFSFLYRAELEAGMVEHEVDHVLFGIFNSDPIPNPVEASDWWWIGLEELGNDLIERPEIYVTWLRLCFESVRVRYQFQVPSFQE